MTKDPGDFWTWLRDTIQRSRAMQRYRQGGDEDIASITSDVPCDDCALCCTSGMMIPVFPEEAKLVFIKSENIDGTNYLKQDADGSCVHYHKAKGKCLIYDSRPVMCRSYDCRSHLASRMIEGGLSALPDQWGTVWYEDNYRALVLQAIHLAAVDTESEFPGANSIICSDRGVARFPEYLGAALAQLKAEAEREAQRPKLILPGLPGDPT